MEAFFNLSLPKDWQSLSDSQLQYFFTQLSHDLPMEEILTLCLYKWADLRVLCKTHDGSYLVKRRRGKYAHHQTSASSHGFIGLLTSIRSVASSYLQNRKSSSHRRRLPGRAILDIHLCRQLLSRLSPHQERGFA
ncbi:hypothetical protein [uncultured Prevotella sp.]|uniref:hypothetical protein n=1 Tax=uncultured Prevotella sp. TaxID=159272 RepID=UPI00280396B0|nr:hypothetical protein [uncultured Prevotella sp.]